MTCEKQTNDIYNLWSEEQQGKKNNDQPKITFLPVTVFGCSTVNAVGAKTS